MNSYMVIAVTVLAAGSSATAQVRPGAPINIPVRGPIAQTAPPIWGFADLHVHQMASYGFGGLLIWGSPYDPIHTALRACTDVHGPGGIADLIGNVMTAAERYVTPTTVTQGAVVGAGTVVGAVIGGPAGGTITSLAAAASGYSGHKVEGFPHFDGWPRFDSYTHQQVHAEWLKRAHDGGLQLMVMYAVNNESLCEHAAKAPGRSCDDMESVDAQIQHARDMESRIDNDAGGPGKGWYRVVTSPAEARAAIARGQLAVVLGTELSSLFGCKVGSCTPQYVREQLDKYYRLGLRQIVPIHVFDNAFGGAALYNALFNGSNGSYFDAADCSALGLEFTLQTAATPPALLREYAKVGITPRVYPGSGHCNRRGLTPLGDFFLREMMSRKMIVDVDHMSWQTLDAALRIATENRYPVVNSHTGFLDVSRGQKRSEGQKTLEQLRTIASLGGLVAPITHQGTRAEIENIYSPVPHDCSNSSQSWLQAYTYAVQQLTTSSTPAPAVALGSDFNGLAGQPGPRFGPDACGGPLRPQGARATLGGRISYPFGVFGTPGRTLDRSQIGLRVMDYNEDGLAHIGLLPDFIEDARVQLVASGASERLLDPLFRSAEAYIRMWEAIERTTVPAPIVATSDLALEVQEGPVNPQTMTATVTVIARDKATGAVRAGTVIIDGSKETEQARGVTGMPVRYTPCRTFDTALRAYVDTRACKARVEAPGYLTTHFEVTGT